MSNLSNHPPVSSLIGVSLIVIFSLYLSGALKTIPCGDNLLSSISSNFVHVDGVHLISNLYSLYALSRIEVEVGGKLFSSLLIFSLLMNSILEMMIHLRWPTIKCSIGFSGLLFSILTWDMITTREIDRDLFLSIIGRVILPSIKQPKVSLYGHLIGAFTGIISGVLFKILYKPKPNSNNE